MTSFLGKSLESTPPLHPRPAPALASAIPLLLFWLQLYAAILGGLVMFPQFYDSPHCFHPKAGVFFIEWVLRSRPSELLSG